MKAIIGAALLLLTALGFLWLLFVYSPDDAGWGVAAVIAAGFAAADIISDEVNRE